MKQPPNPGPPLTDGLEICADDRPAFGDYARAVGLSGMVALVTGGGWFALALFTGALWGAVPVLIGILTGLAVLQFSPHRTVAMGAIAAAAALAAALLGYGLLWLPAVAGAAARALSWYHPVLLMVGMAVAFWLAGPRAEKQ